MIRVLAAALPSLAGRPVVVQNYIHLLRNSPPLDIVDYPQYDMVRVASVLENLLNVKLFVKDYSHLPLWMLEKTVIESQIDAVVFDSTSYQIVDHLKALVTSLRAIKKVRPECLTILSGRDPTFFAEKMLRAIDELDIIVCGETEESIRELIQKLATKHNYQESLQNTAGLAYKDKMDNIVRTAERPVIENLDTLPHPAYHYLPVNENSVLTISTARGCPFSCSFCYRMFRKVRAHEPAYIVDLIDQLHGKYGVSHFTFDDEITGTNVKWLEQFNDESKKLKWKVKFNCYGRADMVKEERVDLLKEAGCYQMRVGVESGSEKILEAMNKRSDREKIIRAIKKLHEHDIKTLCFVLLGYPPEDQNTIQETIDLLTIIKPSIVSAKVVQVLPGTKLYQKMKEQKLIDDSLYFFNSGKVIPPGPLSREELEKKAIEINRMFNQDEY